MKTVHIALSLALGLAAFSAQADIESAKKLAERYASIAKNIDPNFAGLSATDGEAFFKRELVIKGKPVACASCHTDNPADNGKHIVTGKPIRPLSPAVNDKRFADLDKVEKNFTSHCNDIIGRDCTAQEKGDYIMFLLNEKQPSSK